MPNGVFLLVLLLSHETCWNVTPICFIQNVLHIKYVTVCLLWDVCVHVTCYGSSVFTGPWQELFIVVLADMRSRCRLLDRVRLYPCTVNNPYTGGGQCSSCAVAASQDSQSRNSVQSPSAITLKKKSTICLHWTATVLCHFSFTHLLLHPPCVIVMSSKKQSWTHCWHFFFLVTKKFN